MDDPRKLAGIQGNLLGPETGVLEDHVCARIIAQGGQPVAGPPGLRGVMFFRKLIHGKWKTFSIPASMGPDGYRVHELDEIEKTLAPYDIEIFPIDRHLN